MRILGPSKTTAVRAVDWARKAKATPEFQSLAVLYWRYAPEVGIRPEVAYAQASVETGFGKFGGIINAGFHNPCGLKTTKGGDDKDPLAHQRFATWNVGVQAHLDHLALYAGAHGYPKAKGATFDPRHVPILLGRAKNNVDPGLDTWATADGYGKKIATRVVQILPG